MLFLTFLKHEIFKKSKNSYFLQNILFFIISCSIFLLIIENYQDKKYFLQYITSIALISTVFSLIFSNSNFLKQDFEDGTIEQILLFSENFELYIIAKSISNWLFYALPIAAMSPFIIFLFGFNKDIATKFFTLLIFSSISINFICTFCASLNLSSQKSSIIAIFALPLIIPVILILMSGILNQENFIFSLELLVALSIIFTSITTFTIAKIVKIVIN